MHNQIIKLAHPKLHRLRQVLPKLAERERTAIYLRFWENQSIYEISRFLRISWNEADQLLESALFNLRNEIETENNLPIVA